MLIVLEAVTASVVVTVSVAVVVASVAVTLAVDLDANCPPRPTSFIFFGNSHD
jgi:hypothetical protein